MVTTNYAPFFHDVDNPDHGRAFRVTDEGGLNIQVAAGRARIDQTVFEFGAAVPFVLLAASTYRIYISAAGAITAAIVGAYPADSIPLAVVVTGAATITSITDERCFFYEDTGGGGGAPHNLLDGVTHPDTAAASPPATGSLVAGDNSGPNLWTEYPVGADGRILIPDAAAALGLRWATGLDVNDVAGPPDIWTLRAISAPNAAAGLQLSPLGAAISPFTSFRVYGTDIIADAVNFEALIFDARTGRFTIEVIDGGTGTARPLYFDMSGVNAFFISPPAAGVCNMTFFQNTLQNMQRVAQKSVVAGAAGQPALFGLETQGLDATAILTIRNSGSMLYRGYYWAAGNNQITIRSFLRVLTAAPTYELVWLDHANNDILRLGENAELYIENLLDMVEIATPGNPAAGRNRLYFKADDSLYGLNDAGVEVLIGPSAAGGFPNAADVWVQMPAA